jgi:hypothetical protein
MDETCDMHGRDQKCIKILAGKSEGKKYLGRFIRTSEDIVRIDLQIWWEVVDFVYLVQGRKKWRAPEKHGTEHLGLLKCGQLLEWVSEY